MKITIHSHPRSGTVFLIKNLSRLIIQWELKIDIVKSLLNDIEDQNNYKVAVIREPISTIISSYAHNEFMNNNHDGSPNIESIKHQVIKYVEFLNTLENNFDSLHIYTFENLEKAFYDTASNFGIVPDNFILEFADNDENHLSTSKNTDFYNKIIKTIDDYSIFDPAIKAYNDIVKRITN